MRTCYSCTQEDAPTALAVLDVSDGIDRYYEQELGFLGYLIYLLNVPPKIRGRGIAKSLLQQVCQDADKDGIQLMLEFSPYPGTDPVRLHELYARFGFKEARTGLLLRSAAKV